MGKEISINLNIAEHRFPLTIRKEEEEVLRKAAGLLDNKFRVWRADVKYRGFEGSKLIALAALEVVAEQLEKNKLTGKDKIEKEIEEIHMLLENGMIDI